jgi:hypothetical protein
MIEHKPANRPLGDEEFVTMALRYLDGLTSPDEELAFSDQLEAFPHRRDQFVALCRHAGMLRETFTSQMLENSVDASADSTSGGPNAPQSLPPVIIHTLSPSLSPIPSFLGGMLFSYLVAAVVLGMALLLASVWKLSDRTQITHDESPAVPGRNPRTPDASIVARITGMVECVWEEANLPSPFGRGAGGEGSPNSLTSTNSHLSYPKSEILDHKSLVALGDRLALRSGLLELTYDTGARVILQGPVTYKVESSGGGYLSLGKLTARLEKKSEVRGQRSELADQKSEIMNHQFAVRTPTALVTDLGTEFGVEVGKGGDTTSHVFRGSVEVRTISVDETAPRVRVLRANESARVEFGDGAGHERTILLIPGAPSADFVRVLPQRTPKTLDLVDVVAGGNGFSGQRNRGIDPTTGRTVAAPPQRRIMVGDGRYHRVEGLPFVDGVFIPDRLGHSIQTDSAGHAFDAFGTAFNETPHCIWAGGAIPTSAAGQVVPAVLGDVDYSSSGHGLLYMHANKGITFDLDAIRHANPGYKLVRFHTVVGNTETAAVLPFSDDTVTKNTLFSDDFQSATVGAPPDSVAGSADPATGSRALGTWDLRKGVHTSFQVQNNVRPGDPKSEAGTNKYLAFTKASNDSSFALATGWAASSTEGQIVQLNVSIYVPSGPATDVFGIRAFTNGIDASGPTIGVVQYRNGEVNFHDGINWKPTTLIGKTDAWQNIVIIADMAAKKYSINLDGNVFGDARWAGNASTIGCLYMSRPTGAVGGKAFIDNLRLQSFPKPSTFGKSDPRSASADAWILVDGERRSGRRGLHRQSGANSIVIPLAERDRFLTLVATDGGNGLYWDSIIFGDPQLELRPTLGTRQ